MRRYERLVLVVVMAGLMLACPASETGAPESSGKPSGSTKHGPDPVVVDADHYTVEFENEMVRLLRIRYGVGEESTMHYHPDSVAVFLTDQRADLVLPDGSTQKIDVVRGRHKFLPGGDHLPKNVGDGPFELALVELQGGGTEEASGERGPDPTEVDASHYVAEFENDQVRILRITYEPGTASVMHYHPASVAVFLTDQQGRFEMPDGTIEEVNAKAGEQLFLPAGMHLPTNTSSDPLELILVELKGS